MQKNMVHNCELPPNPNGGKVVQLYPTQAEETSCSFYCPAVKLVQQLLHEVRQLRQQLDVPTPKLARLDNSDLMREFHIGRRCAADWRNQGLEYTKIGKKIYYERSAVDTFLAKRKVKGF